MPKISVIMGIHNTNNVIMVKQAIDSILNQSYSDFEFIICDDGSTDNTYDVVNNLIKKDSRCILIQNKTNKGLAQTLNNCLKIAKGEYIARMDADDISELNRFELQINFLENNKEYGLVSGWGELFDENGIFSIRKYIEKPTKENMLFGSPFLHAGCMMRKEVLVKLKGYRVSKETRRAEDYDLWMRLYALGYKGYNLQKVIYKIREDKNAYKRRKYRFRIDEAKVRYYGFKRLGLFPKGYIYILKPLIVGLIPQKILSIIRKER